MKRSRFPFSRNVLVCALLVTTIGIAGCGSSGDKKSDKKNGTTTTTFTFSGADSKAFCADLKKFSSTYADVVTPGTPDELRTRWAALTTGIEQLERGAPSEIKGSLKVLRARIRGLTPALEAVGYMINNVPQAARDSFQDDAAQRASDKISAYGTQVCKQDVGK